MYHEGSSLYSPDLAPRKPSFSAPSISEIMKPKTFHSSSELIDHLCKCSSYSCDFDQCQQLKLNLFHYSICDKKDCKTCSHVTDMIMEHKKTCNPSTCTFIVCKRTPTKIYSSDMAPPRNYPNPKTNTRHPLQPHPDQIKRLTPSLAPAPTIAKTITYFYIILDQQQILDYYGLQWFLLQIQIIKEKYVNIHLEKLLKLKVNLHYMFNGFLVQYVKK